MDQTTKLSGKVRRAFSYGDSSSNQYIWYSVEVQLDAMSWVIPPDSPYENLEEWRRDRPALTNPAPAVRGSSGRGRAQARGRPPYTVRGRGGGRGNQQSYWREVTYERFDPYAQDRGFEAPEGYSSGIGRSSGGARERERRRDISPRVGYREAEEDRVYRAPRESSLNRGYRDEGRSEDYPQEAPRSSRYDDRRPYQRPYRERDHHDYGQERQEDYYQDERISRDSRRGDRGSYGAERARAYGYRGREA